MRERTANRALSMRYGFAVVMVIMAVVLRWFFRDLFANRVAFVTFFPAVAMVALVAGGGPSLLATVMSQIIVVVWLNYGIGNAGEVVASGLFLASGVITSTTAEMLRRAQQREADAIAGRLVEQERELAEQDERYRLLADHAEDFVALNDTEGNRLYVSPSFYRRTGWTPEEVQSTDWRTRLHPDDVALVERTRAANLAGQTTTIEYRIHCRDGSWIWVEAHCKPVTDGAGQVRRMVLWARDVTERKRAEQAQRDKEERLRSILNTAADAIIVIDRNGNIDTVNPAAEKMFGYSAAEMIGQNVKLLMPSPYCDDHEGYLRHYLETGETRLIGIGREVSARRRDGTLIPVDLAVSEIDHLGLFTGILRDITERKELQKQVLEISVGEQRRIGQELHDGTQQELTGLELMTGTLLDLLNSVPERTLEGQSARWLDDVQFSRLCNTVMKVNQKLAEANRHVKQLSHGIMPVQIDAAGLQSALAELAASINRPEQVACRFDCPGPVTVANNTTATHLYRIAQEAVNNALRHGQADEIQISLAQPNGQLLLEVRDNGVGFDAAAAARSSRTGENRGMGLRIMEYRAGIIGGTLHIERRTSGGTSVNCVVLRGGSMS